MSAPIRCTACKGSRRIVGLSGNEKDCPRCQYPVLNAQREARQRKRYASIVLKHSTAKGIPRTLLLVLATHADVDHCVSVAVSQLARECRCNDRTIQRSLMRLVFLKEISRIDDKTGGRSRCAVYRLDVLKGDIDEALYEAVKGDILTPFIREAG